MFSIVQHNFKQNFIGMCHGGKNAAPLVSMATWLDGTGSVIGLLRAFVLGATGQFLSDRYWQLSGRVRRSQWGVIGKVPLLVESL